MPMLSHPSRCVRPREQGDDGSYHYLVRKVPRLVSATLPLEHRQLKILFARSSGFIPFSETNTRVREKSDLRDLLPRRRDRPLASRLLRSFCDLRKAPDLRDDSGL